MRDIELYERLLGLCAPWHVEDVDVDREAGWVRVRVEAWPDAPWCCPECHRPAPGYDHRSRRWRHLDTMQYDTVLEAKVPRVRCAEHGVRSVSVPWAEPDSGYTALFEALVIDGLREGSVRAVARLLGLSWGTADRIMQRASATEAALPQARDKIAFDTFHVAPYLGNAVDAVHRQEHKALRREGDDRLKRSRYHWLRNPHNMSRAQRRHFSALRDSNLCHLKTARAWALTWALKESAMDLWHYQSRTLAEKSWKQWIGWAQRCRLEPMKQVGQSVKRHLWGILNAAGQQRRGGEYERADSARETSGLWIPEPGTFSQRHLLSLRRIGTVSGNTEITGLPTQSGVDPHNQMPPITARA